MLKRLRFKKLLIASAVAIMCALPTLGHAQGVMRIAAVVNDDVISAHDLAQRINLTIVTARMPNTPEVRKRLARTILRTMIDERLKEQAAKEAKVEVSDDRMQNSLKAFARSIKIQPDKINTFLNQFNIDPLVLEEQIRAELSWGIYVGRTGGSRIRVTKREIDLALAEQEANKGKPEYSYSEIYLPVDTADQDGPARQMAARLIDHIQNGSPFSALARDFSKAPSAQRGGNVGWIQSGNLDKTIEQSLSRMESGMVSAPLRTPSGYHIVKLNDKRIFGQETQDETVSISQAIFPVAKDASEDIWAAKEATARNVAAQAQNCAQIEELGKQYGNQNSGRVDNLTLSKMPPAIRKAIMPLQKGQSTVFRQPGQAVLTLMVCERQAVAAMPEVAKRNQIKQRLQNQKIQRENRRLMQKLRRSAFVDIRL